MAYYMKSTIDTRNAIFKKNGYVPWQPAFEKFGADYNNRIQTTGNELKGVVSEFYEISSADFKENSLVTIPDACTDFMFAYDGEKLRSYISTGVRKNKKFYFGDIKFLFGVRFMPGETYSIFKDPIRGMVHNPVSLDSVLKNVGNLEEEFMECDTFGKRVELLTDYISVNTYNTDTKQEILSNLTALVYSCKGNINIEEISKQLGYSARYIQTLCNDYIGMTPKEFCQTVRIQYALMLEKKNPQASLETISSFAGYADISHMNREFKKYMFCKMSDIRNDDIEKCEKEAQKIVFSW
nr:helix-turn-helix transcriptional regulator [uncultured Blautia sp.]